MIWKHNNKHYEYFMSRYHGLCISCGVSTIDNHGRDKTDTPLLLIFSIQLVPDQWLIVLTTTLDLKSLDIKYKTQKTMVIELIHNLIRNWHNEVSKKLRINIVWTVPFILLRLRKCTKLNKLRMILGYSFYDNKNKIPANLTSYLSNTLTDPRVSINFHLRPKFELVNVWLRTHKTKQNFGNTIGQRILF